MKRSLILAALIAIAAIAWVASGQFGDANGTTEPATSAVTATPAPKKQLTAVRVQHSEAEPRIREVVVRGHTEAKRVVTIKAEVAGTVAATPLEKGALASSGAVIAELAVDERKAKLDESYALVRQRELEFEASESLSKKGYRAETQLAGDAAQLDAARATVKQMELQLAKTKIQAPFDAVIEDRMVEVGDYLKVGDPVALLVDPDPFLVVGQVSEKDVGSLKLGATGRARLVTGEEVEGRITYMAAMAQEGTRTFRVEIEVPNPERRLRVGITADIRFSVGEVPAHFVSPAVLTLDDAGAVGVRTVNADGVVQFHPVELIADTVDGVWLGGLPQSVDIISVGQEFVRKGERVRVVRGEAGQTS